MRPRLAAFALLTVPLLAAPAVACPQMGNAIMIGFSGMVVGAVALWNLQRLAFSAVHDFMRGVTPDRGGPYWIVLGFLADAAAVLIWFLTAFSGLWGAYLALSLLPKLIMAFAGTTRQFEALRSTRPNY